MREILEKLNLIRYTSIDLPIDRLDFLAILYKNVDQGSTSIFANPFEVFSSSRNEYIGSIQPYGFKIKRRRRLFDMNMSLAVSEGTITQMESGLRIAVKTTGFSGIMIPFYAFILFFYIITLSITLFSDDFPLVALPFLCIHATIMLGVPYLIMRRGAKRMAYNLERDLFYMTHKAHKPLNS